MLIATCSINYMFILLLSYTEFFIDFISMEVCCLEGGLFLLLFSFIECNLACHFTHEREVEFCNFLCAQKGNKHGESLCSVKHNEHIPRPTLSS